MKITELLIQLVKQLDEVGDVEVYSMNYYGTFVPVEDATIDRFSEGYVVKLQDTRCWQ